MASLLSSHLLLFAKEEFEYLWIILGLRFVFTSPSKKRTDGGILCLQYEDGDVAQGKDLTYEDEGTAGIEGFANYSLGILPQALLHCPHCGRGYTHKSTFKRHLRAHVADKRYSCGMCGYRAIQRSDVTRHMRTHTGEKPYSCPYCHHRATQSGDLDRHIVSVHPTLCQKCQICTHLAPSQSSMFSHLRKKHT